MTHARDLVVGVEPLVEKSTERALLLQDLGAEAHQILGARTNVLQGHDAALVEVASRVSDQVPDEGVDELRHRLLVEHPSGRVRIPAAGLVAHPAPEGHCLQILD